MDHVWRKVQFQLKCTNVVMQLLQIFFCSAFSRTRHKGGPWRRVCVDQVARIPRVLHWPQLESQRRFWASNYHFIRSPTSTLFHWLNLGRPKSPKLKCLTRWLGNHPADTTMLALSPVRVELYQLRFAVEQVCSKNQWYPPSTFDKYRFSFWTPILIQHRSLLSAKGTIIHISCGRQFSQCDFPEQLITSVSFVVSSCLSSQGWLVGAGPLYPNVLCPASSTARVLLGISALVLGSRHRGRCTDMQCHCVLLIYASWVVILHMSLRSFGA